MYFCYQSIVSCNITLTDEGNENGEKTTIGLISIKATLHVQHTFCTFFCRCFARLQREKLPESSQLHFFWRKCPTCSRSFSLPLILRCIGGLQHFSCCYRRYKIFMLFFQYKKMSPLVFLSLALDFCRPCYRQASLACRLLCSFNYLLLYIPDLWA